MHNKLYTFIVLIFCFNTMLMATGPRISTAAMTKDKNEIFALDLPPYISTEVAHGGMLNELVMAAFNEMKFEVEISTIPLQNMIKYYYTQENAPGFMGRHLGLSTKTEKSLVRIPLYVAYENYFYYKPLHPKGLSFKGELLNLKGLTYGAAKGENITSYKNANIKVKKSRALSLFKKLKNGSIDFISMPKHSVQWFIDKRFSDDKDNFVMMQEGSSKVDVSLYFNMNNPKGKKMEKAFQKGLKAIVKNGKYATILRKYLNKDEVDLQIKHINKYIK